MPSAPDKRRLYNKRYHYRSKFGLTLDALQMMQDGQDNKCMICKNTFRNSPCVDHDHHTGKIRGLLCSFCNRMLGVMEGPWGQAAKNYLKG